ncbi:MAG: universal stress protein [Janthinobacterium lividum]
MSVLAAYLPEKGGRATLQLAAALARGLGFPLAIATILTKPWESSSSAAKVDADFETWSRGFAADAERQARAYLAEIAPGVDVQFHHRRGKSVSATLIDVAADIGAALLVLGSSPDGHLGQVTLSSTSSRLLHSSPLAVALAPRGYRGPKRDALSRVTCAATGEDEQAVVRSQQFAQRFGVRLRVLTLAVRGRTMWPSSTGFDAEDDVLAAWTEQAQDGIDALRRRGVIPAEVDTVVGSGRGWRDAIDSVDWDDGELLVVGSRPEGPVARVFLGSRATKILRHAPVPVLLLPG